MPLKNSSKFTSLFITLALAVSAQAKTVCTMTFNSENEKQVFSKNLSPLGYEVVELVPDSKDPSWLSKSCNSNIKCDILLLSGHFGGLFFGERKSTTLSLQDLIVQRENKSCGNILDARAVYLMGCNTLASKIKDHRTVDQYLRVLVNDGFPLNLAENVASARYLNFGQSMNDIMTQIFSQSKMVVGFDSTGPLGSRAAPLLQKAFNGSSKEDKLSTGISAVALKTQFAKNNIRVTTPSQTMMNPDLKLAISADAFAAHSAWKNILSSDESVKKHYDFIVRQYRNLNLARVINNDIEIRERLHKNFTQIIKIANGLSAIQIKSLNFLKNYNVIAPQIHTESILKITSNILSKPIDYVSADQLCEIFKEQRDLVLPQDSLKKISGSTYSSFLSTCRGEKQLINYTPAFKCLVGDGAKRHDWACLTENAMNLDVQSCQLAKSRNHDPENADDMLWFCYDKMLNFDQLSRPDCLELTHSFSILGNQLKMNWNCLNRLSR